MRKIGLARDIDLALHIPLRYEDETSIVKLADAREGDAIQIEATVVSSEVQSRPRRQLLVTVDDGTDTCVLRFFSAYPAQQKALADHDAPCLQGRYRRSAIGAHTGLSYFSRFAANLFAPSHCRCFVARRFE
jgi:ATP-dependent DNA helicase RecG